MTKNYSNQFAHYLEVIEKYYSTHLPHLPENARETLVKIAPYAAIVLGLLAVSSLVSLLSISSAVSYFAAVAGVHYGPAYYLGIAGLVVTLVLYGIAIPGLFARKLSAWNLMLYSSLASLLFDILSLNVGSIVGGAISLAISLYVLFQVKSYYKN